MHVPKTSMLMSMLIYTTLIYIYIKPVCQWRNVISGGPGSKFSKPPPSRSAKCTSRAPYMHKFSRGPGLTWKMFES